MSSHLAIVLSRRDFGESDQIIFLYTLERGKVEALAKGVKKIISKNSSALEPFCLIEVEFAACHHTKNFGVVVGKELDRLIRARAINIFAGIRGDLDKSFMAQYAVALVNKMAPAEEKDDGIFSLLFDWLAWLEKAETAGTGLLYGFIVKLFKRFGFEPEPSKCVACGQLPAVGDYVFYPMGGGRVCSVCRQARLGERFVKLDRQDARDFAALADGKWARAGEVRSENLFVFITEFIQCHSESKLAYFAGI
ncbi:DNA repair protein RecO [Patescibacteria group bacterium]|nr:MAG: DNA repair protein RecO [Patescibacteria group bacterium]